MNTEKFLELLDKSGLVSKDQVDEVLASLESSAAPAEMDDAEFIGKTLVQRGLLTPWHLRQLLKRRYKGFFIRQYKMLGLLGAGGMSTVYLAEHTLMQRRVAIKVLPKERLKKSAYLDHFVREAQVIATLDHPNIVRAYDIDREDDIHYIVMEFFEGINLQKKVETEGPLAVPEIVLYIRQAAAALAYAHKIGIIHRDVKPGNFLVNAKNEVKMLDLGLAMIDQRLYSGHLSSSLQEASILGTADYLAPEQAINSQNVDSRADIYALGGVLYFCLTGHSPFPTGSVSERLLAHQHKEPSSILKDRPNTAKDLVAICQKMMAKKPSKRYQTADEVVRDLDHWLVTHGHQKATPITKPVEEPAKPNAPQEPPQEPPQKPNENIMEPKLEKESAGLPPFTFPPLLATGTGTIPKLKLPLPLIPRKEGKPFLSLPPGVKADQSDKPKTGVGMLPPVLSTLPPIKKQTTEQERREYLTSSDAKKTFGKFDDDSVTTTGAGPLIFGENQDGVIDLSDIDSEMTVSSLGMKTDVDLTFHEELKIDDSFLTPDSSVDLGGKTDPDIETTAKSTKKAESQIPEGKKEKPVDLPTPSVKQPPAEIPKIAEAPTKQPEPKLEPKPVPKKEPVKVSLQPAQHAPQPVQPRSQPAQPEPQLVQPRSQPVQPKPQPAQHQPLQSPPPKPKQPQPKQIFSRSGEEEFQTQSISPTPQPKLPEKPQPVKPQPVKPKAEKPKSLIQVDDQQPLSMEFADSPSGAMRAPIPVKEGTYARALPGATAASPPDSADATSGVMRAPIPTKVGTTTRTLPGATATLTPDSTDSPTGTHSFLAKDQVVIKPPAQGRILQADPQPPPPSPTFDIFPVVDDSLGMDIFPIAGEILPPRSAPAPATQPTAQTSGKTPSKKKQLTDEDYDKMITNFVSSQMPGNSGNENDPAVLQAVEELKRAGEAKKTEEEEKRKADESEVLQRATKAKIERDKKKSIVQKIGTITGIHLKPALKKELEMEEPRGPVAAPRPKKENTWFEMVPAWFWVVFGFFITCTLLFGLIFILS